MNLLAADPSTALLAACGGDTVKLFDVTAVASKDSSAADPCAFTYSPSPGSAVNSLKWNHTNLVVASGGDDKKISLWWKNGQRIASIGSEAGDVEEAIYSISFGNKPSRYLCSGGSGQVVKIWDLQRKRCIKRLKGHTDTITGVSYNCKDDHLASISLSGDILIHNLASGAKAELKDPNNQVLRVLDYSRSSRHLLVTAGDDGTVILWDTSSRSPKVSWLKQHSAPTAGISFSPTNDKIVASVGLDKKLYTFDSGSRRPSSCISYEAPFSSLAFRDDGMILAAGSSNGHVVFYDVRGKPLPLNVIRAYSSSEAVSSLCWQRSKPVAVNESNCSAEMALLGGAFEDFVLMPDPLPSMTASNISSSSGISGSRNPIQLGSSLDISFLKSSSIGSTSLPYKADDAVNKSHLWPGGTLTRLHPARSSYNFDDIDVFSPVVDVDPSTPSLGKPFDFTSNRRYPLSEDGANDHPINQFKSSSTPRQDAIRSSFSQFGSSPRLLSKNEDSAITPPEAWGGEKLSDRINQPRQSYNLPSQLGIQTSSGVTSGSMFPTLHGHSISASQTSLSPLINTTLSYADIGSKDVSSSQESTVGLSENVPLRTLSLPLGTKNAVQANPQSPQHLSSNLHRRFSYAERISTTSSFSDGISLSGSPKIKKTGAETRDELLNSLRTRSDAPTASGSGILPPVNVWGGTFQSQRPHLSDSQQGSSFTLQLFQHTLEETLDSFKRSIHDDIRNLHLDVIRQFHMQETSMSNVLGSIMEKQSELMHEVQSLRKENQRLRQLL